MNTILRALLSFTSVVVLLAGLVALGLISGWLLPPGFFIAAVALPLIGVVYFTDQHGTRILWIVYVLGFVLFAYLRSVADELPVAARYDYVITLERALPGPIPTLFLQGRLYALGRPDLFDWSAVVLHFSYFLLPHLFCVGLMMRVPRLFGRYVVAAIGTYYMALLTCVVLPTAPPWLAAQEQRIPYVYRIVENILLRVNSETYTYVHEIAGTNPVAAMPSLHFAITWTMALAAWKWRSSFGLLCWAYCVAMGVALVYSGEHYVVDLIAGAAVGLLMWTGAPRILSVSRRYLVNRAKPSGEVQRGVLRGSGDHSTISDPNE